MSVRASQRGIEILDSARKHKRWNRQSHDWYILAGANLTLLKKLWRKDLIPLAIFKEFCRLVGVDWREAVDYKNSSEEDLEPIKFWEGMPKVSTFYGRTENVKNLTHWIVKDKCRLVVIHGLRGIGKTTLAVELTKEILPQFDYVVGYSLASNPLLKNFLTDIFKFLKCHSDFDFLENIPDINIYHDISELIRFFKHHRCLLVLDGLEILFSSGKNAGYYEDRHIDYGNLMRQLGKEQHKSCVIITTFDKPREIALLEETNKFVQSHKLEGLGEDARGIFQKRGLRDEHLWKKLSDNYRGNPLFLKIISSHISIVFCGSVDAFLRQGTLVTGNLETCLEQIFNHLSDLEKNILYILAERNEIVSAEQLIQILTIVSNDVILAIESLVMRSLVENTTSSSQSPDGFTLAPVIKEYVSHRRQNS